MKTEKQSLCCFCMNLSPAEKIIVDSDIPELLKFICDDLNTSFLENSSICDTCLNKILEACSYKVRNTQKMLRERTIEEINSEQPEKCQMCRKELDQGETYSLIDCVTQIDWSDFVTYLFTNPELTSLGKSRICDTCRVSVINIEDMLKLLILNQSKTIQDVDKGDECEDIDVRRNKSLVEDKIEIKQELDVEETRVFENLINDDRKQIYNNFNNNYLSYVDFKCKNEEVELKMEYVHNYHEDQTTHQYYQQTIGEFYMDNCDQEAEEEEEGGNSQPKSYSLQCQFGIKKHDVCTAVTIKETQPDIKENFQMIKYQDSIHETNHTKDLSNIQDLKCIYCSKIYKRKSSLDNHLLTVHKCKDKITIKIYECKKCSYLTTRKNEWLNHNLKHGIKDNCQILKCPNCTYETYNKYSLIRHIKSHQQIKDFKCTYCSREFKQKLFLVKHLFTVHKDVTNKMSECQRIDNSQILKCYNCPYETLMKDNLIRHVRTHLNIRNFKCTYCLKVFTRKQILDDHLLTIHKRKDNVTSKIYECEQCNYATTKRNYFLRHNLKHGIRENSRILKCHHHECTYETYLTHEFIRHSTTHNDIRDFVCTYCSKGFAKKSSYDNHLFTIHKCTDVASQIYKCNHCSYTTIIKAHLLRHNLKHPTEENSQIFKCPQCSYETFHEMKINKHMKKHNIRDFKCTFCSREFAIKKTLDDHLLKKHYSRDVKRKIYTCNNCSFATAFRLDFLQHNLKHGSKDNSQILKCQQCPFETYFKGKLSKHQESHQNNRDYNCTVCPQVFSNKRSLDSHLIRVHNSRDNVTTKTYQCETCGFTTVQKIGLLRHKLKHGIRDNYQIYKCYHCSYETSVRSLIVRHVKVHNEHDFKCTYCLKGFHTKVNFFNHILIVHKSRDNITRKIHECDKCSYATTKKSDLLIHGLKHVKVDKKPGKCVLNKRKATR